MTKLIDIQAQIEALKKQADAIRSKEFASTVADIRAKMAAFGITVKDLQSPAKKVGRKAKGDGTAKVKVPKTAKVGKPTGKVEAKYKGPNGETWSGRGLTPKWLASLGAQGRSKEEFLVDAAPSQASA